MNREIKCRIRLQEKETGEKLTLFNSIFDAMIGVAWFEIDRNKWAFLGADEFTGLLDKNGKEIYEGDVLRLDCDCEQCPHFDYVIFENGMFKYKNDSQPLSDASDVEEIIGNIYQNPELLTPSRM